MNIRAELIKLIKKVTSELKNEDELTEILKKRLTKKELKLLKQLSSEELEYDKDDKATQKLIKKLNQESLKQELYRRSNKDAL